MDLQALAWHGAVDWVSGDIGLAEMDERLC
jgi:hypothetical protein